MFVVTVSVPLHLSTYTCGRVHGFFCPAEVGIKIGWFSGALVTHFIESQRIHSNTDFDVGYVW